MANGVTYRFEFGAALDEAGFNSLSAGLKLSQPQLFSYITDIVVKPAVAGPPSEPAHTLTVHAVADDPFAFDLYPVAGLPTLPEDSLVISGNLSFSLTDSILGSITRIGVRFQATGTIAYGNQKAAFQIIDFQLTEIRGEQPPSLTAALTATGAGPDPAALGRTFTAIVQYLSDLYLKSSLEKSVLQFPVPSLDTLVKIGTLALPVDGIFIRNKAMYFDFGKDLGGPSAFPACPAQPVDLRAGVSTLGLTDIFGALLPLPVPLSFGNSGDVLSLTSNLQIPEIDFKLVPGAATIPVAVHIGGTLDFHFSIPIPVLGGHLNFDIPIPLDKFSQYGGSVTPVLTIDAVGGPVANPQVSLKLLPDTTFLGNWYLLVETDYRDYLAQAMRDALNRLASQLLGNSFCHIPILGWIVCGIIDVTATVTGYLLGAVLDLAVSTVLTVILNAIARVAFLIFATPQFSIFSIDQMKVMNMMGLSVKNGKVEILDNGRDADLQLDLWFQDQGLPVPLPPTPAQPLPVPPPQLPPVPGAVTLPEYPAGDFLPAAVLPNPVWTNGATQKFSLLAQSATVITNLTLNASFEHNGNRWRLRHSAVDSTGQKVTDAWADYDDTAFTPIHSEYAAIGASGTVRQVVDYTMVQNSVVASLGLDGMGSVQTSYIPRQGVLNEFDEFWIYRLAAAPLDATLKGSFGRTALVTPTQAVNWAREIPVVLSTAPGTLVWQPVGTPAGQPPVPVWIVSSSDEQATSTVYIGQNGQGLLKVEITAGTSHSVLTRLS
ncbi:MAG: hypothetical protein WAN35_12835 [Terracidiphilus sp.]